MRANSAQLMPWSGPCPPPTSRCSAHSLHPTGKQQDQPSLDVVPLKLVDACARSACVATSRRTSWTIGSRGPEQRLRQPGTVAKVEAEGGERGRGRWRQHAASIKWYGAWRHGARRRVRSAEGQPVEKVTMTAVRQARRGRATVLRNPRPLFGPLCHGL